MRQNPLQNAFKLLSDNLDGEIFLDSTTRSLYSTDASIYEELPLAVAVPKTEADVRQLILFAIENGTSLIPRTAGTSLAGQVVGAGIVVDMSKHFNQILQINEQESWVRVQPGVIRDELNMELAKHELYFAPETSTSNRAMIGGMLGNNSCGANSIVYGSTRESVLEVSGFLSDGTRATFGPVSVSEFETIRGRSDASPESKIYQQLFRVLSQAENQIEIRKQFPIPSIKRRNMGYAIDLLLDCEPFGGTEKLNLAKLIAGSEGTLFFATAMKLGCVPIPPKETALVCAHFKTIDAALHANALAMHHAPFRCELIDRLVIEGARRNLDQQKNTQFVIGEPEAILMIEFRNTQLADAISNAKQVIDKFLQEGLGFEFPVLNSESAQQAWELRKSGLGVVHNKVGETKPVTVIEDTAVDVADLPGYVAEIDSLLKERFDTTCVHYGHSGAGELHLRPILNLSSQAYRANLKEIASAVAHIVKKYQGSLSGEHGDGRLRAEFLQLMLGKRCHQWFREMKQTWDPGNVFNPGKIVNAPPMDTSLRQTSEFPKQPESMFRFAEGNLHGAAAMCSGSGDCRKTHLSGGTMCPSYMATRNEKDSTRGRANILRQVFSNHSADDLKPFDDEGAKQVLDLCLSCKACKTECPSNVDMAKIKSEFMHGYHQRNGTTFRTRKVASFEASCKRVSSAAGLVNFLGSNRFTSRCLKRFLGIHPKRSLPKLAPETLRKWLGSRKQHAADTTTGTVALFCDEFTNYIDVAVGKAAIELLESLGYRVVIPDHVESGRSAISQGMLHLAREYAESNVRSLSSLVTDNCQLIGIEPSSLLTIRDEYPDLVRGELVEDAKRLASNTFLIDEFISLEIDRGKILPNRFSDKAEIVLLHGHCHQKALSSLEHTKKILSLPANVSVIDLETGCCGMAGFFGFEKEHFDLSMQIGRLVLFPAIEAASSDSVIAATGTSCRHQILDGLGRNSFHPVQLLRDLLVAEPRV